MKEGTYYALNRERLLAESKQRYHDLNDGKPKQKRGRKPKDPVIKELSNILKTMTVDDREHMLRILSDTHAQTEA